MSTPVPPWQVYGPGADEGQNRVHEVEGVRETGYPERWRTEILAIIDHHDSHPGASSLDDAR